MKVFIDTEFTDFRDRDLISIGLVAENGAAFYGENLDYCKPACSQFVKDIVLPLCNFAKHGMRRSELSARAWVWLDELPAEKIEVVIDYRGDWELLGELFNHQRHPKLEKNPTNILTPAGLLLQHHQQVAGLRITPSEVEYGKVAVAAKALYEKEFDQYFIDTGEIQHHALSDAKANLRGYVAMMNFVHESLKEPNEN